MVSQDRDIKTVKIFFIDLEDVYVFPNIVLPIFLVEADHIDTAKRCVERDEPLFIVSKKENQPETASFESSVYAAGTIVSIVRTIHMSDGRLKALVQGVGKGIISNYDVTGDNQLSIYPLEDLSCDKAGSDLFSLMLTIRKHLESLISLGKFISPDMMMVIEDIVDVGRLADVVSANINFPPEEIQNLLCCVDPYQRLTRVEQLLLSEIEYMKIQVGVQNKTREELSNSQREYFLREQIKIIQGELGDTETKEEEIDELTKKAQELSFPDHVQKVVDRQLKKLARMPSDVAEATITRNYIECLLDIPWNIRTEDSLNLANVMKRLEEDHFGISKVKERIIEFLAVKKLTNSLKGPILCLVGPPGVGKTSLGKSIARAIGREFIRIALGGIKDEAEIRGHRRTYIGAMPGRIIQALQKAKKINPVILLDEIDKVTSDMRGDPASASALIEVLDPEQNHTFVDHFVNLETPLSDIMFIATANSLESISSPLLDRMEVIDLSGYTEYEKLEIANRYLIPKQIEQNGLKDRTIEFNDPFVLELIRYYTRESGVRNLERSIASVCRKMARKVAEADPNTDSNVMKLTSVFDYLGKRKTEMDILENREAKIGTVVGLAWTQVGGDVIHIETNVCRGKGQILQTGCLGDVMKESIMIALSYIRSRAYEYQVMEKSFMSSDFHVHVPAGAIPKDGPSAGVSMATCLFSVITALPVHQDIAMTGEVSLHGRVLPVGGLKEKLLAAIRYGVKTVIVPKKNQKDIEELDQVYFKDLEIVFVETIEDVFKRAIVGYADFVPNEVNVRPNDYYPHVISQKRAV